MFGKLERRLELIFRKLRFSSIFMLQSNYSLSKGETMINSIVSQGSIWAILGLGIFMTFRILDFPDMTTVVVLFPLRRR